MLWLAGATYQQAAAELGYSSRGDAYRAVWRAIRRKQWAQRRHEFELLVRRRRRTIRDLIRRWPDDERLTAHLDRFETWARECRVRLRDGEKAALDAVGRTPAGVEDRAVADR